MSFLEQVTYKEKSFEESPIVLCRIQKFMYKYLSSFEHPEWFYEILRDIYGNSFLPVPKFFFDEEIIEGFEGRKEYIITMLNKCIDKMNELKKQEFLEYIAEDIKDTFFDISEVEDLKDEDNYRKYYINTLVSIREMMED